MNAIGLSVGRLDVCHAGIAPIHLHVVQPRFGLALAGVGREGGATLPCCDEHFVEESLPHLVDNDQVLEGSVGKVDARGSPERERRMAWKHIRIGIPSGQVSRDMKRVVVRQVLLHACKVRSDPHAGDDAAGVLTARSQQGPAAGHESGLSECRVKHAAELRIGAMTSGANDDRLASPDVYGLATIVDVAVLPEALQTPPGLRIEPWRITGPDTHNTAGELLLANNLVHVAVEYELHTFFTSGELQTPGERRAVRARAFAGDEASVLHHTWREVTRAYLRDSGILFRDRSLLDVRSGAFHEEGHRPPRARHSAIAVGSEYPAKTDVIRHEEFSSGGAVIGVSPMQIAFVVSVGCLGRRGHNRPIGMVSEQEVRILSQFLHRLPPWRCDESLPVILAGNVPQLKGIPTAKRNLPAAVQHLAAQVEVLVDDDHGRAKVPRTNGGGQPGAPSSDDDDIGLVVPLNSVDRRDLR